MATKDIVQTLFRNKEISDCIIEIEKQLSSDDVIAILSSIESVAELFTKICDSCILNESVSDDEEEKKYKGMIFNKYQDLKTLLLSYLSHDNKEIKEKVLETLMKLVVLENKCIQLLENPTETFPFNSLFQEVICRLLSSSHLHQSLNLKFKDYLSHKDIKFFTLKVMKKILTEKEKANNIFLTNCYYILSSCFPLKESPTFLSKGPSLYTFNRKKFSRVFSAVWEALLTHKLSVALLKKVLLLLPKAFQYLQNPIILTDFLTELYNKGGLISLLSLNGLFRLMQKYNVEYPDFYSKLYSLFTEEIINGKYNASFFCLSDLFLSSTHLPAYMVAAFIKKLSRISRRANHNILLKLESLVHNLLVRHPSLVILLNRPESKDLLADPFDETAPNATETKAMDCSLWEIKDIERRHFDPNITLKVKLVNELPKLEVDLSSTLDITLDSMYKKHRKRKRQIGPSLMESSKKYKYSMECLQSCMIK